MLDDALSDKGTREPERKKHSWTLIGISESEVGSIVNALVTSSAWDVHFLWKSPYVIVQIETPEHSPLPLPVRQSLDLALRPYLVSKRNKTAGEILQDACSVRWQTSDAELSTYLPAECRSRRGESPVQIDVTVAPSLTDLLSSGERLGQMTMSVRHQDGKTHQMTFPMNRALLAQNLPEYAAWCVLKTLTTQNG